MQPRAVYIHVPFCIHHCGYCDFTVIAGHDDLMQAWFRALQIEVRASASRTPVETVFIGGGTPTHLPPALLEQLIRFVREHFDVVPDAEFSIEANPDGLTDDVLKVLANGGVNRLSLGVQSFDDASLDLLERRHSAATAIATIRRCAEVIPNVSVDLIFAVPGQSAESWESTLNTAVALPVRHISTYGLTWESGTPFVARESRGQLQRVDEEIERAMYLTAIALLKRHGFAHYEVSNFAMPGNECRHNQIYWAAEEYFAFGPGASRYVNGERSTNTRNVRQWINSWLANRPCIADRETLAPEERAREAIMLALRTRRGLHMNRFEHRFGYAIESLAGDSLIEHQRNGFIDISDGWLRLTDDGLLIADTVVADFL